MSYQTIGIMHHLYGKAEGKCSSCKYYQKGTDESCLVHQKFTSYKDSKWIDYDACGQINGSIADKYLS